MNLLTIILATHNGEQYLSTQLDSLLVQTYSDFRIWIHDDGSVDGTVDIIRKYVRKNPYKINFLDDDIRFGNALGNFNFLLLQVESQYVMLCDQDDVWNTDKVSLTLQAMKETEAKIPNNSPILVHTNLEVVDAMLHVINKSFWRYQNLNPKLDSLNRLLVQNTVTGCTVMINSELLKMAMPIPKQAIMHDWWLALIAAAFGKIIIVNQPTVLYRQHRNNDTGAKKWSVTYIVKKALTLFDRTELLRSIRLTQLQAEVFYNRFSEQLADSQKSIIIGYISLGKKKGVFRALFLFRNRLLKQGVIRNIALFLRI